MFTAFGWQNKHVWKMCRNELMKSLIEIRFGAKIPTRIAIHSSIYVALVGVVEFFSIFFCLITLKWKIMGIFSWDFFSTFIVFIFTIYWREVGLCHINFEFHSRTNKIATRWTFEYLLKVCTFPKIFSMQRKMEKISQSLFRSIVLTPSFYHSKRQDCAKRKTI